MYVNTVKLSIAGALAAVGSNAIFHLSGNSAALTVWRDIAEIPASEFPNYSPHVQPLAMKFISSLTA